MPARVCTAPCPTKMIPATNASGKTMYSKPRVMSTQKFPMVGEFRREKPRTRPMATAMPIMKIAPMAA